MENDCIFFAIEIPMGIGPQRSHGNPLTKVCKTTPLTETFRSPDVMIGSIESMSFAKRLLLRTPLEQHRRPSRCSVRLPEAGSRCYKMYTIHLIFHVNCYQWMKCINSTVLPPSSEAKGHVFSRQMVLKYPYIVTLVIDIWSPPWE